MAPQRPGSVEIRAQSLGACEALRLLHYGGQAGNPDSHSAISFWRKHNGRFENLGGILSHELNSEWHRAAPHVHQDAYFTINSILPSCNALPSGITGLPLWKRSRERLRWLNALWVDLDQHGGAQLAFPDLVDLFELTRERAGLPPPSIVVSSGRGLWGIWRLHGDKNGSEPVRATPDGLAVWERVESALVEVFRGDPTCKDSARVMRIPDSWNTNASQDRGQVMFCRYSNSTHSLPELASLLGVRAERTALTQSGSNTTAKNPRRQAAGRQRWERAWSGFVRLLNLRGGRMSDGCRRNAIFVAAYLLARLRRPPVTIESTCRQFSANWALDLREVPKRVAYGTRLAREFVRISNRKLCLLLKVTASELGQLPEWKTKPQRKARLSREDLSRQIGQRRARLKEELVRTPAISARKLAARLGVHYSTVLRDLTAADPVTPSLTGARVSGTWGDPSLLPAMHAPGVESVTPSNAPALERERRRRILAEWSRSPASVRDMAQRLRGEHGILVSHMTVQRDLAAIRAAIAGVDRDYTLSSESDPMRQALGNSGRGPKHNGENEAERPAARVVA